MGCLRSVSFWWPYRGILLAISMRGMGSSYIELAPWHLVPPTSQPMLSLQSHRFFFISQPTGTSLPLAESISALAAGVVDPGTELLYFEWPYPDIVSDIPSEDVWSIWYIFWHATWHSGIYSDVLSDILSGILSGIYSGILSDILLSSRYGSRQAHSTTPETW